ncbi:hypothetical protein J6590_047661 [Homalodisca vitripennis]|nr:hypothetical protein J6590_047661 [Homalodisca vitripennis]
MGSFVGRPSTKSCHPDWTPLNVELAHTLCPTRVYGSRVLGTSRCHEHSLFCVLKGLYSTFLSAVTETKVCGRSVVAVLPQLSQFPQYLCGAARQSRPVPCRANDSFTPLSLAQHSCYSNVAHATDANIGIVSFTALLLENLSPSASCLAIQDEVLLKPDCSAVQLTYDAMPSPIKQT